MDLDLRTRFDLLSSTSRFNFISLFCYAHAILPPIPEAFLADDFHRSIYESFTEKPEHSLSMQASQLSVQASEKGVPQLFVSQSSPEFFDELDALLVKFPDAAESILAEHLPVTSFHDFHESIRGFFRAHRSIEACRFVARFVIRPFISQIHASANRLVSDALIFAVPSIPEIFVDEVIQPVVFNPNSEVYQFELLQRLFTQTDVCRHTLARLFGRRPPSLEAPLRKEALNFLCTAIQKSPVLDPRSLMIILLHLKTQLEHNPEQAARPFIFLLRTQDLKDCEQRDLVTAMIDLLPSAMQHLAQQLIEN
jgi:hypothetical protein